MDLNCLECSAGISLGGRGRWVEVGRLKMNKQSVAGFCLFHFVYLSCVFTPCLGNLLLNECFECPLKFLMKGFSS